MKKITEIVFEINIIDQYWEINPLWQADVIYDAYKPDVFDIFLKFNFKRKTKKGALNAAIRFCKDNNFKYKVVE